MSRQARVSAFICAAVLAATAPPAARAGLITQTASLPLTTTDFGPGNAKVAPLVFQQFDTQNNTLQLDSVTLTFHAMIQNQFGMKFTTPATITDSVATGNPNTPGPTLTLYQPDGIHALLTVSAPNDPTALTRSVTYGFQPGQSLPQSFGSDQAAGSAFYLAPATSQASNSLQLTAPADLAIFTGTGKVSLPVSASAFSKFTTSSGNGFGSVTTQGSADVTISYQSHTRIPAPETVPEPAAVILWGIGGVTLLVAHRVRRRRA